MSHSVLRFITFVMFTLIVSACGKRPQVVTGIQVQTSMENSEAHLSLKADLNLGSMMFPQVTLPIPHPRTLATVGSVELLPVLGGKNQIKISVNLTAIAEIRPIVATLPNGNAIPLIANNPTIVIPLPQGAKLYLTLAENAVALGVAVPIKQFDAIGQNVGGVNLFPVFMIDQVKGSAGLFTSRNVGQNGFAIVADVTGYVKMQDIYAPAVAPVRLNFAQQIPSQSIEQKIGKMIYNLNLQKVRLRLR